ncbi:methyltransferase domain-containing protein [Candidatus Parcubacteria bacterium]|nr:methyltransferase domain-containing protein [Patescibacteria group bacterium]MCG2694002.1 methyltransferase domain-containing protein [Candidatus Parcubacteria bacterium]
MIYIPTSSELLNSDKVLEKLDLRAGMTVTDLGCGTTGHFVFPSAKIVGENGKVYAVDILKSALSSIESKVKMQNFNNIETVWSDIEVFGGAKIPDESCDAVYLINVHCKPAMIKEALRLLKKDGKLLLVDWKVSATDNLGPATADRVSREEAKKRVKEFQLKLEDEFDAGKYHWGLIFKKTIKQ